MPTYPLKVDDGFLLKSNKPTPYWLLVTFWLLAVGILFLPGWYTTVIAVGIAIAPTVYIFTLIWTKNNHSLEDRCPFCRQKLCKPEPHDIGDEDGDALIYDCDHCQISWDSQVRQNTN